MSGFRSCAEAILKTAWRLPSVMRDLCLPMNPIVSIVNASFHRLSSFRTRIIGRLVGKTDKTVKNSGEFVERIRESFIMK